MISNPISSCLNILKDPLPGTISRGNVSMAGFELWTSNDESTWSVSCTYSVQIFLWLFWGLFICLGFIGSSLKRPPIKHLKSHAARRCKTFIVSKFCEKCWEICWWENYIVFIKCWKKSNQLIWHVYARSPNQLTWHVYAGSPNLRIWHVFAGSLKNADASVMGMCVAQHVVLAFLCWVAQPTAIACLCCGTQKVLTHRSGWDASLTWTVESHTTPPQSTWNAAE